MAETKGTGLGTLFLIGLGVWFLLFRPSPGPEPGKASISGQARYTYNGSYPVVLEGATVQVNGHSTLTNDMGMFAIANLEPGIYNVTVSKVGFTSYLETVQLIADQDTFVDATLIAIGPASLEGYVKDSITGAGIPNISVIDSTAGDISTVTDSLGHYILENIPHTPGKGDYFNLYDLSPSEIYQPLIGERVLLIPDQLNYHDFVMTPYPSKEASLFGRVTNEEGVGIYNVQVIGTGIYTKTDAEGYYAIDGLPTGEYLISFFHSDYEQPEFTIQIGPGPTELNATLIPAEPVPPPPEGLLGFYAPYMATGFISGWDKVPTGVPAVPYLYYVHGEITRESVSQKITSTIENPHPDLPIVTGLSREVSWVQVRGPYIEVVESDGWTPKSIPEPGWASCTCPWDLASQNELKTTGILSIGRHTAVPSAPFDPGKAMYHADNLVHIRLVQWLLVGLNGLPAQDSIKVVLILAEGWYDREGNQLASASVSALSNSYL